MKMNMGMKESLYLHSMVQWQLLVGSLDWRSRICEWLVLFLGRFLEFKQSFSLLRGTWNTAVSIFLDNVLGKTLGCNGPYRRESMQTQICIIMHKFHCDCWDWGHIARNQTSKYLDTHIFSVVLAYTPAQWIRNETMTVWLTWWLSALI